MTQEKTISSKNDSSAMRLQIPSDPNLVYDPSTHFPDLCHFETTVIQPALVIPARRTADLRQKLKEVIFRPPKTKDVYPLLPQEAVDGIDPKTERKLLLIRNLPCQPNESNVESEDKASNTNDVSNSNVYEHATIRELLEESSESSFRKSTVELKTGYDHLTVEQVLCKILPTEITEIPSAFEIAGNVAHLNLREETLPFKKIIGKVILDQNKPRIRTVVNKVGKIEGVFRTFQMEILAGDSGPKALEVDLKEEGSRFRFNFAEVYWNSRLQHEHRRLVKHIAGSRPRKTLATATKKKQRKDKNTNAPPQASGQHQNQESSPIVVADIMAGVGPFAIPLTSQYDGITVHANDLNPRSHHYLVQNAQLNKCGENLKPYNLDGRKFIRQLKENNILYHHVIMNLPATAVEFLNAFRGWSPPKDHPDHRPMVHVHCFESKNEEEAENSAMDRCEKALGCKFENRKDVMIHVVRDVSPNKNMLCVSFRLPSGVINLENIDDAECIGEDEIPPSKKARLEE